MKRKNQQNQILFFTDSMQDIEGWKKFFNCFPNYEFHVIDSDNILLPQIRAKRIIIMSNCLSFIPAYTAASRIDTKEKIFILIFPLHQKNLKRWIQGLIDIRKLLYPFSRIILNLLKLKRSIKWIYPLYEKKGNQLFEEIISKYSQPMPDIKNCYVLLRKKDPLADFKRSLDIFRDNKIYSIETENYSHMLSKKDLFKTAYIIKAIFKKIN
jgi:hypothetical protein